MKEILECEIAEKREVLNYWIEEMRDIKIIISDKVVGVKIK